MAAVWNITLDVEGDLEFASPLVLSLNQYQRRYLFRTDRGSPRLSPNGVLAALRLTSEPKCLFSVCRDRGIVLCTHDAPAISRYLDLRVEQYLSLAGLSGLVQWRVLEMNVLINPEDCPHTGDPRCLYGPSASVQDSLLLLENPKVWDNCRDFYSCMGAETELILLLAYLERLRAPDLTALSLTRRLEALGPMEGSDHGYIRRPAQR